MTAVGLTNTDLSIHDNLVQALSARAFRRAVTAVYPVTNNRTIPILGTIRLQSDGVLLSLTSSDLDRMVTVTLLAPNVPPLDVAVWARALRSFLQGLEGEIDLSVESDGKVKVSCGDRVGVIPTMPVADFFILNMPADSDGTPIKTVAITLDAAPLHNALSGVSPCMSTERSRYYLNGAYMHVVDGALRFVATDGRRLMLQDVSEAQIDRKFPAIILPHETVGWLAKNVRTGPVTMAYAGNHIEVIGSGCRVVSKLIDGTYPDYPRVVPGVEGRTLSLAVASGQADTVRWLSRQTDNKTARVKLTVNGATSLSASAIEGGLFTAPLACYREGADLEITFNGKYLVEALAGGLNPVMSFTGPADPVRIDYTGSPGRVGVLMPVRQ